MAGENSHKNTDGKALHVDLLYTVPALQVAVIDGWLGVTATSGDSGDTVAMTVEQVERQFTLPAALDPSKGDTVYIEVADVTGHIPDDTAYSTTAGAGKVAFFKVSSDVFVGADGNDTVMGIVLPNVAS